MMLNDIRWWSCLLYTSELTASIADGSFRLGGYQEREIEEYGKKRILQILSMKDRIAVFAIMNVVDRHLQKRDIRTTGASIKMCIRDSFYETVAHYFGCKLISGQLCE